MSHCPLTNSSGLKITAAYCAYHLGNVLYVLYHTSLRNYAAISLQVPSILSILLGTYDESVLSVLKLSKVSFRGKCARTEHPLKLSITNKTRPAGSHFPPASQAGPVFYTISFLWSVPLFFIC
jgi:hypothetical protein